MRLNDCVGCGLPVLELEGQYDFFDSFYLGGDDRPPSASAGGWHLRCLRSSNIGPAWQRARLRNYCDVRRYTVLAELPDWIVLRDPRDGKAIALGATGELLDLSIGRQPTARHVEGGVVFARVEDVFHLELDDVEVIAEMQRSLEHTSMYPVYALLAAMRIADRIVDGVALEGARFLFDQDLRSFWLRGGVSARLEYGVFVPHVLEPYTRDGTDLRNDPRLKAALGSSASCEALAGSSDPLGVFLRRAGAFYQAIYEEVQYTDWNGTPVGTGDGELIRAAIPPDPTLPFTALQPLLAMGSFARRLVARHPSTPETTLLELFDDGDILVAAAVRSRATNPPAVLERIRERDASGPVIDPIDDLRARARHWDEGTRANAASSPSLPRDAIEELAGDPCARVRWAVAKRKDLTPTAFARLVEHELTPLIVEALAENRASPPSVLARLHAPDVPGIPVNWGAGIRDERPARVLVAGHPSLPDDLALACARDDNSNVRSALAANPAVDVAILDLLLQDDGPWVRVALAKNPRFTRLGELASDPDARVRTAVAARADAPREVLERLARDDDSDVRDRAVETLRIAITTPS